MTHADIGKGQTANQQLADRATFMAAAMLVVFPLTWLVWFVPFDDWLDRRGTPLGADFSMFYVAGRAVLEGEGSRLYDQSEHQQRLQSLFPGLAQDFCLPYRYPPLVAWLMAPLAALPYPLAYACFLLLSLAAYSASVAILIRELDVPPGPWRRAFLLSAAGWPVAWETLLGGQASMFALLVLCVTLALVRRGRFAGAGAVLALAAYKPTALCLVGLGLVLRYPKLMRGLIPSLCLLGLATVVLCRWALLDEYTALALQLAAQSWDVETPFWKVHGLAGYFSCLFGDSGRAVSIGLGVVAVLATVGYWRTSRRDHAGGDIAAIAILVALNALFNAYTPIYDLVLLLPCIVIAGRLLASSAAAMGAGRQTAHHFLFAAVYFGPHLSQLVAPWTGLQPFTAVMAGCAAWLAFGWATRALRTERESPCPGNVGIPHCS